MLPSTSCSFKWSVSLRPFQQTPASTPLPSHLRDCGRIRRRVQPDTRRQFRTKLISVTCVLVWCTLCVCNISVILTAIVTYVGLQYQVIVINCYEIWLHVSAKISHFSQFPSIFQAAGTFTIAHVQYGTHLTAVYGQCVVSTASIDVCTQMSLNNCT
jgi:hypothetical protein